MNSQKSLYDILEISENASPEVIKAAYLSLIKKYHPDSNPAFKEEATKITMQLNQAYTILSDTNKRKLYDQQLHGSTAPPPQPQQQNHTVHPNTKTFFSTFSDKCFVLALALIVIVTAILGILNRHSPSTDPTPITVAETTTSIAEPKPTVTPDGKHYHKIGPPDVSAQSKTLHFPYSGHLLSGSDFVTYGDEYIDEDGLEYSHLVIHPPTFSGDNFVVKLQSLYDADLVYMICVQSGGKDIEVNLLCDDYEMSYACGSDWYGENLLFGDDTKYYKCPDIFEFYHDGDIAHGQDFTLYTVPGGNMHMEKISADEF